MKKNIFYSVFAVLHIFLIDYAFAQAPELPKPEGSIDLFNYAKNNAGNTKDGVVVVLELIQNILLTVGLPLVAVGTGIYIAYLLLTAEGDENKMKTAWKAVLFSAIAMLVILFSAFVVQTITSLKIS